MISLPLSPVNASSITSRETGLITLYVLNLIMLIPRKLYALILRFYGANSKRLMGQFKDSGGSGGGSGGSKFRNSSPRFQSSGAFFRGSSRKEDQPSQGIPHIRLLYPLQ